MGNVNKPNVNIYWATDDLYWTPIFAKTMSRDRLKLILKFSHFNYNSDPNHDPKDANRDGVHKTRSFLDMIRDRFQKVYNPGQNLSVDKSLVLFKGRLHFRQYIKTKCACFGIRLYELTTSGGIIPDVLVYCRARMLEDNENSSLPLSKRIPEELMTPFLDEGHVLFTDN